MTIRRYFQVLSLLLFGASVAQGQIAVDKVTLSNHHPSHQDSSYHCKMCDKFLFNDNEATILDKKDLYYHGIATNDTKTPFHCAGCDGHLGYYDHKHETYEVINRNVDEKDSAIFHCLSCQMPIFDQKALANSDESFSYFKEPIDKKRIALEERNKFYNIQNSHATCRACKGRIGEVTKNDTGGFGMRLNLGSVKKKKRS